MHELRVQMHEFKSRKYKFKFTIYEFKFTSYEFKPTSNEFEFTSYEYKFTSYEFKSINYEFKFTSSRIIISKETQINSLAKWLASQIISVAYLSLFEEICGAWVEALSFWRIIFKLSS